MKKRKDKIVFLLIGILTALPFTGKAAEYQRTGKGFEVEVDSIILKVSAFDGRTIRIQAYPAKQTQRESMVVNEGDFNYSGWKVSEADGKIRLETEKLWVDYDVKSKRIRFIDKQNGETILTEKERAFVPFEVLSDRAYSVKQTFLLSEEEAIYGLGQFQEGDFNYRGKRVNLVQANREIANPVLLSTKKYVLYWDNYSKTVFEDKADGATFWSEMGDGIDYYFIYGEGMQDAVAGFRHLTGEAPMFPKSAFGFWMSKERYQSFDELTAVVKEYRKRRIPLDNIVQDWQYWGKDRALWNSMEFHPDSFPNPKKVIDDLHQKYHVKLTLSVWPGVGPETRIYQSMDSIGALFDVPTWADYKVIDIYNPKAQELFWDYLYRGLYSQGVDSWWLDATEPSFKEGQFQEKQEKWTKEAGMTHIGPFHRYLNTYSLVMTESLYHHLREVSNQRVSILTRSAFAGQQKYATSTWSGDIYASWEVFKKQIPAGLNLCMTGIPYWTTDIGGFIVKNQDTKGQAFNLEAVITQKDGGYEKGLDDPAYLELYTRWFQYAVFNPMMRAHGTDIPREIWHFGEKGTPFYDAQLEMIDLRYSLLSYIYAEAWKVTSAGATMMRALAMDFTSDPKVYNEGEGFLFGESLLVYPVLQPMYYDRSGKIAQPDTKVSLYLPEQAGKYWFDFNSSACYPAGTTVDYDAPLNKIPVFVKAGSIVPRNQPADYAGAEDNREMELHIYAGADAAFTLYEDDNETYDYEKGLYSTITFQWDEKAGTLSISSPEGKMKPLTKERLFNVKLRRPEANGQTILTEKQLKYTNKTQKIRF